MKAKPSVATYEAAMKRLEMLVREIEAGEVPVDQLGDKISEAHHLIGICRANLATADEELEKLLGKNDKG